MRTVVALLVVVGAASAQLRAQGAPPTAAARDTQPPFRDPTTARVLGTFVPGAGHVYAGEYRDGVRYYLGSVSGITGGAMIFFIGGMPGKPPGLPLQVSGVVLIGMGIGVWVRSSLDAPRAAERANVKHHAAVSHLSLVVRPSGSTASGTNVGFAVAW